MPTIVHIADPSDGRIEAYRDIRERDLVQRDGLFVAEGKVVLTMLLASNIYRPRAIKRGFMKADDNVHQMYVNQANDALKVLDGALAKSSYLVGDEPTIADVAVYGDVAYAEEGAIDLAPYANVKAWMARVEKLPGFKKYEDVLPKQDAA